jgi:hypothetical protein
MDKNLPTFAPLPAGIAGTPVLVRRALQSHLLLARFQSVGSGEWNAGICHSKIWPNGGRKRFFGLQPDEPVQRSLPSPALSIVYPVEK